MFDCGKQEISYFFGLMDDCTGTFFYVYFWNLQTFLRCALRKKAGAYIREAAKKLRVRARPLSKRNFFCSSKKNLLKAYVYIDNYIKFKIVFQELSVFPSDARITFGVNISTMDM